MEGYLIGSMHACRRQVELIQDLEFPAACHRMKATPDGQFLFATGIHAPRLRVYELGQLSMKFERHFDSEIIDFQVCGDDACHHEAFRRSGVLITSRFMSSLLDM